MEQTKKQKIIKYSIAAGIFLVAGAISFGTAFMLMPGRTQVNVIEEFVTPPGENETNNAVQEIVPELQRY